jgi:hypothetical protein
MSSPSAVMTRLSVSWMSMRMGVPTYQRPMFASVADRPRCVFLA